MTGQLTVSLGQFSIHKGDPESNMQRVREWTAEAARRGSDVVIFPELWDTGYALDRATVLAGPVDAGRFMEVASLAREHRVHLYGSLLEVSHDGAAYNTGVWYGPDGDLRAIYRKLHLFRLMDEHRYLQPGGEIVTADLPWGRSGLAICYDLRFPEQFRRMALGGAVITFITAEWPHPRLAHWRTLLRARAIENQMFVVACNRSGQDESTQFCGHSVVLDAWGEVVIEAEEEETLLTVTLDLSSVAEIRGRIPVFDDRRSDLYG
ncbi:MAG: carbon-nitrogen family hydrolase [Anaerolineae bacterium]|nr:carbon-nitrogen family hydrolase [Anaerolineae bacterium]